MTKDEVLKLCADSYQQGQLDIIDSMIDSLNSPQVQSLTPPSWIQFTKACLTNTRQGCVENPTMDVAKKYMDNPT